MSEVAARVLRNLTAAARSKHAARICTSPRASGTAPWSRLAATQHHRTATQRTLGVDGTWGSKALICSCATQFLPLRGGGPAGPSSVFVFFCAGRVPREGHAQAGQGSKWVMGCARGGVQARGCRPADQLQLPAGSQLRPPWLRLRRSAGGGASARRSRAAGRSAPRPRQRWRGTRRACGSRCCRRAGSAKAQQQLSSPRPACTSAATLSVPPRAPPLPWTLHLKQFTPNLFKFVVKDPIVYRLRGVVRRGLFESERALLGPGEGAHTERSQLPLRQCAALPPRSTRASRVCPPCPPAANHPEHARVERTGRAGGPGCADPGCQDVVSVWGQAEDPGGADEGGNICPRLHRARALFPPAGGKGALGAFPAQGAFPRQPRQSLPPR